MRKNTVRSAVDVGFGAMSLPAINSKMLAERIQTMALEAERAPRDLKRVDVVTTRYAEPARVSSRLRNSASYFAACATKIAPSRMRSISPQISAIVELR